jgi:hypothetical protein
MLSTCAALPLVQRRVVDVGAVHKVCDAVHADAPTTAAAAQRFEHRVAGTRRRLGLNHGVGAHVEIESNV